MDKRIKTLCMYLPQFHRTPENDLWWGEGFTEWTAVKRAIPLFEGHMQPIKPLNENYYDLLEKKVMKWQASLMGKYGIDGQCFYHYYFKDGRKILEKPAENLLEWKEIRMPYCFCWANGSWTRTWSNIRGNSWADKFETVIKDAYKDSSNEDGVLLEQRYGREHEWKVHFEYLLPFFRDERYIKMNGAPVFLIHSPLSIPCLIPMIEYWRKLAKNENIPDIYVVGMNTRQRVEGLDALMMNTPHMVWKLEKSLKGINFVDYQNLWERITQAKPIHNQKTYYCGVPNCDDTPRRGTSDGVLFKDYSDEKFYLGMCDLYRKSIRENNAFVFINAWNEWGEGMYLEPDDHSGYAKLEAICKAQNTVFSEEMSDFHVKEEGDVDNHDSFNYVNSFALTAKCFDQWMTLREKDIQLSNYMIKHNLFTIAIYGYGMLAKHLLQEFKNTDIAVDYIIDKSSRRNSLEYDMKCLEDELPNVDAVIITIVDEYDSIYSVLRSRMNCKIVSLYEIVSELP